MKKGSRSSGVRHSKGGRPTRTCDIEGCEPCNQPNCGTCKVDEFKHLMVGRGGGHPKVA
jgi:hypothetical protein